MTTLPPPEEPREPDPEPDPELGGEADAGGEPGPGDGTDDANPRPALSSADVERRFNELVGSLGTTGATGSYPDATGTPAARAVAGRVVRPAESGGQAAGPRDYAVDEGLDEEDEGYVPPDPGPLEITEPKRVFAGLLAATPIVLVLVAVLTGTYLSMASWLVLGGAFVAGVVWFVSLLPVDRDPQDPGAVV